MVNNLFILHLILSLLGPPTQGQATWYGEEVCTWIEDKLVCPQMRNGEVFDMNDPVTIAVGVDSENNPVVPLGSKILVCPAEDAFFNCLLGEARDTGPFPTNNLDLSKGAWFKLFGDHGPGRLQILWWQVDGEMLNRLRL